LVLHNLQAEKSRRHQEREQKGETYWLRVIAPEGEDTTEREREILAEHVKRCPQDRGKHVQWMRIAIVSPPPIDPARVWRGIRAEPEAVAKRETELEPDQPEPKTYVWISVRHAHPEGEHGGEIREGFYDSFDGKIIVTDTKGKVIGSAADYGNPAAVARNVLRTAYDKERPLRSFDIGPIV
jgi:hypothetical protein